MHARRTADSIGSAVCGNTGSHHDLALFQPCNPTLTSGNVLRRSDLRLDRVAVGPDAGFSRGGRLGGCAGGRQNQE